MEMNFYHWQRSVACALWLAVLLSVAIGHRLVTSPDSSVETNQGVEHVDPPVNKQVVISENLEEGAPPAIVATCKSPLIRDNCRVFLAAYGLDDSPRIGYVRTSGGSWFDILIQDYPSTYRGVTLFEIDAVTCTTRNRQRFDTWGSAEDRTQFLETLQSAAAGTIIVGVTADSAEDEGQFQDSASSFFARYNMNLNGLQVRDKFAFIMQKGYPKKTVFQRKVRYGESITMTISLSGYTVSDVNFTLE